MPVCVSRYPLRMFLKFVRLIIRDVAERIPVEKRVHVRVTLQMDGPPGDNRPRYQRPYLLNADLSCLDNGVLDGVLDVIRMRFVLKSVFSLFCRGPKKAF